MRTLRFLVPVLALALTACGYNRIQTLDEQVNGFESQIKVQLQRRADLVPNLVETVRGYAQHEAEVFNNVAEARSRLAGAVQAGDLKQMSQAKQARSGALGRLRASTGSPRRGRTTTRRCRRTTRTSASSRR